jgi:uncharacterized protein YhhL (DUF1145 family)
MLCPWLFSETNFETTQKLVNFSQILGTLNNIFKPTLVQKFSRIKIYNALAFHILLHGSEIWTLKKKDIKTTDIDGDENFQVLLFQPQKE